MGPLKPVTSKGNRYIVIFVDALSCWIEARAIPDTTAVTLACALFEEIICFHGCPVQIVSDLAHSFTSELFENINKLLNVKHSFTSAYHPQTNSLAEHNIGSLSRIFHKFIARSGKEWDTLLPSVLFAHCTAVSSATQVAPCQVLYGRNLHFSFDT